MLVCAEIFKSPETKCLGFSSKLFDVIERKWVSVSVKQNEWMVIEVWLIGAWSFFFFPTILSFHICISFL